MIEDNVSLPFEKLVFEIYLIFTEIVIDKERIWQYKQIQFWNFVSHFHKINILTLTIFIIWNNIKKYCSEKKNIAFLLKKNIAEISNDKEMCAAWNRIYYISMHGYIIFYYIEKYSSFSLGLQWFSLQCIIFFDVVWLYIGWVGPFFFVFLVFNQKI